jgi:hypothetical protein
MPKAEREVQLTTPSGLRQVGLFVAVLAFIFVILVGSEGPMYYFRGKGLLSDGVWGYIALAYRPMDVLCHYGPPCAGAARNEYVLWWIGGAFDTDASKVEPIPAK